MTIEISSPDLEALIRERMKTGAFPTVEDRASTLQVKATWDYEFIEEGGIYGGHIPGWPWSTRDDW